MSVLRRMMDCYKCEAADLFTDDSRANAGEPWNDAAQGQGGAPWYRYDVITMQSVFPSRAPHGIICKQKQNGNWVSVAVVAPFSGDLKAVTALAEKCTALQLCPEHLLDVVTDFVSQSAICPRQTAGGYLPAPSAEGDSPL